MKNENGIVGFCGFLTGLIGGFIITTIGADRWQKESYQNGYNDAKKDGEILSLKKRLGEKTGTESEKEDDAE